MNKELLLVIEAVANEKEVSKEIIFAAMELALAQATKKADHEAWDVRVSIDRQTGSYKTFRCWTVTPADEIENPEAQIALTEAKKHDKDIQVGHVLEEQIESVPFGRISAQSAKQVIIQKVREAERERVAEKYEKTVGSIVSGTVRRVTREVVIIDLGENAEAILPRTDTLPREIFRVGDRVKAVLAEIREDKRGKTLMLSRTANSFLAQLFKLEVPEIQEEVIEIMHIARDPGNRAKVAVKTSDGRIDPVGACVGVRGSRVQGISDELGGERIDIIVWDSNPAQFVINAMAPAEILSIVIDEDSATMDIAVAEEQLSLAIGKGGQNVRLASLLTGWRLNVMSEEQAQEKQSGEADKQTSCFIELLEVDEAVANLLVNAGFTSIDEIAYVPEEELLEATGLDEDTASELRERANNKLLAMALTGESVGQKGPTDELLAMEGMNRVIAHRLSEIGVSTVEDLAEQSVDELMEVDGMTEEKAAELIMKAREPWFQ